jgi:hypothetical protein
VQAPTSCCSGTRMVPFLDEASAFRSSIGYRGFGLSPVWTAEVRFWYRTNF